MLSCACISVRFAAFARFSPSLGHQLLSNNNMKRSMCFSPLYFILIGCFLLLGEKKKPRQTTCEKGSPNRKAESSASHPNIVFSCASHSANIAISVARIVARESYMGTVRFSIELLYVGLFAASHVCLPSDGGHKNERANERVLQLSLPLLLLSTSFYADD